ncbi:class I SAM-dependent methyltransferase [Amycolatopsis sp. 195334CR]|uniref:class I SAM-dependent DNA methyltransferase n=1 Tax=Amycolatopsis sp. 195334CR TaxID=2814588 RepID=UPI001A8EB63D|nr:methyltransferase domain-containing protein [Amycolatopsis sp. 195334CR]MBN6039406.1 methyltransferase domain-containing protein [Amycolatopsis sp. 195334CR]
MENQRSLGKPQIRLPERPEEIDQDAEYCSVLLDGEWVDIRFHDYHRIYRINGLYEQLFHEILDCRSPDVIAKLLKEQLQRDGYDAEGLRVLDLGAGNGLVGEQLRTIGVGHLVGADIIPEAAEAARRERPEVYDAYHVGDVTAPSEETAAALAAAKFNTLVCVAALGYADIPPSAFRAAFNLVSDGGWIAFTIKDRFLTEEDTSGFAGFIQTCQDNGVLEVRATERYRHRLNISGEPLHYVAVVGTKHADIPAEFTEFP